MIEAIVLALLGPILAGASYGVYLRQNRAVWLAIRNDKLMLMKKHDERSTFYKELRDQAIQADVKANNAWREDIDAFVESVKRSQVATVEGKTTRLAIEGEMNRARVSYMEDGLKALESTVRKRRDELIEQGEWTLEPEIDEAVFVKPSALEGRVL